MYVCWHSALQRESAGTIVRLDRRLNDRQRLVGRLRVVVQRRKDEEVQTEGVENEEVASDAIREDDGREREEDLFERIEAVDRSSSFLRRTRVSPREYASVKECYSPVP